MINGVIENIKKIYKYLVKAVTMSKKHTIIFCIIAIMLSTMLNAFSYTLSSHQRFMEISLNYDGAQYGLTPSSGRFDINRIKSNVVIEEAIKRTNDGSLTVENVRPRITIEAKMPKSAIDKTVSSVSNGGSYSYTPAEFVIYYSQKNKFGKNYTIDFLNALAESYMSFFKETYSDKNNVLKINAHSDYEEYDYDEICKALTDDVNSMINYLGKKQEISANFVSSQTGYTYSELITSLVNLRDIDIAKLNAYVIQNSVSKDKDLFLRKKGYIIDREMKNYNYLNGASEIALHSLKLYDPRISGVAFVPTIDAENEYYMSRTKTGLDNLTKISYKNGKSAVDRKKTIDDYQDKYDRFEKAPASTQEMYDIANEMMLNIKNDLDEISKIAIKTDDEYIAKKNNDYISVKLPRKIKPPLVSLIKYSIVFFILLIAVYKIALSLKNMLVKDNKTEVLDNES